MAFPLVAVLTAAPGIISAATDIIRSIREKKTTDVLPDTQKIEELERLIEQQAMIIEELAVNNKNLALAARNNRFLGVGALVVSLLALALAILG